MTRLCSPPIVHCGLDGDSWHAAVRDCRCCRRHRNNATLPSASGFDHTPTICNPASTTDNADGIASNAPGANLTLRDIAPQATSSTPQSVLDDIASEAQARLARAQRTYPSGSMNMAISRRQALNRIEGLIGEGGTAGIEAHIEKLTRPGSGPHIRTELNARLNEIERLAQHTGRNTEQGILQRVQEWRRRISEIENVD